MTENEYKPWTETDETDTAYWKWRFLEEVKATKRLREAIVAHRTMIRRATDAELISGGDLEDFELWKVLEASDD